MRNINKLKEMLSRYKSLGLSQREVGDKFENVIKSYIEIDNLYKDRYSEVWKWADFPLRNTSDTGIDLVAKIKNNDKYCAIQCKFYDKKYSISKPDIDSFLSASGKTHFEERIIFSTTDKWNKNAEDAIKNQKIPVTKRGLYDLYNSLLDWCKWDPSTPDLLTKKEGYKKELRKHQKEALNQTLQGFKTQDRGQLIMACGTGKTFTALKIIEQFIENKQSIILFLVPSLSLLSQTLKEWSEQKDRKIDFYAVCSDNKVNKTTSEDISSSDIIIPATTDYKKLANNITKSFETKDTDLIIILATYQSIDVVIKAQKQFALPQFELVICDEAHRTTGVEQENISHFLKIHHNQNINAKKRLYMTATPRIYHDTAKKKATENNIDYFCMDDIKTYGEVFYRLTFGEAVKRDLLTDYQVLVLTVSESYINQSLQIGITNKDGELTLTDNAKLIGCFNALAKKVDTNANPNSKLMGNKIPMKRAIAFSGNIKDSKNITNSKEDINKAFQDVVCTYTEDKELFKCDIDHVDGTQNTLERNRILAWLKEVDIPENECRILSNSRCLSEGVDVPSLDAILFLKPRKSTIDIIQSVGRVMRKYEGKEMGYIILPITVPAGAEPEHILDNNKNYSHIWDVLNALRSHDESLEDEINKISLNINKPSKISIIGTGFSEPDIANKLEQQLLDFSDLNKWKEALYAQIVDKCGTRTYWANWTKDIATIANRHIKIITEIIKNDAKAKKAFDNFLDGLQKHINNSIQPPEAIEMLAQHIITKPVFNALFDDYNFTDKNPVSKGMQNVLDTFSTSLEVETKKLDVFYDSVKKRATGIDNAEGKQKIIIELYDKFFKSAFPKMIKRLGIVYTPIEIVDFIINSADDVLKKEFSTSLGDKNVHILDPFTGTGTFITRLLNSGIIDKIDLEHKYKNEIHANEIVLLAYYIATINIEMVYHFLAKKDQGNYTPFEGICLTDTFNMFENEDKPKGLFSEFEIKENSERIDKLKDTPLTVIMGNPPYSSGQKNENDNNKNIKYTTLDKKIKDTYANLSTAQLKSNLYDSYKRAIRFATDRLIEQGKGIVSFVTNGSFLDANVDDGLRKTLVKEYSSIYIFNLRGNQRTSGETARKEGGQIFGSGSRAPICISLFVMQKIDRTNKQDAKIYYHDIGDYLKREEKLKIIKEYKSFINLPLQEITPNKKGDWLKQRNNEKYETYQTLGNKDKTFTGDKMFLNYSLGIVTNRDAWVYNFSKEELIKNVKNTIAFYNSEVDRLIEHKDTESNNIDDFVNNDNSKISWSLNLKSLLSKKQKLSFNEENIRPSLYRPFCKQYLYYAKELNESHYQIPQLIPQANLPNIFIGVIGKGAKKGFSPFITNLTPDQELLSKAQWFAMYSYTKQQSDCYESKAVNGYIRTDNIADSTLDGFRKTYNNTEITREDIFYYIYGLLHSVDYQSEFFNFITKEIPRIPMAKHFTEFSTIGKKLADLHINYENTPHLPEVKVIVTKEDYPVAKIKFKSKADKSSIIYNNHITIENIPSKAYDYVVNGKSAIEWIIDRYEIKLHKDSRIRNDPNLYSSDAKYILNLLLSVISLSVQSIDLISGLPKMKIIE